jgi:hypothetical protein
MRDQYGQHAFGGNRLQEEPAGNPGGDAHLARLQDDVAGAAILFKGLLRGVRGERAFGSEAVADVEHLAGKEEERRPVVTFDRGMVEEFAYL